MPALLTVFSANANSLKNRMDSLRFNIDLLRPSVIIIQETKLKRKNQCELKGYKCFMTLRGDSGGGLLLACHERLEPTLIYEGDSECEVLSVQIAVENQHIRIVAGYGPQECAPIAVREGYRTTVEEQIERAKLAGCMTIVAEDANAKLGPTVVPNDPHPMSENGKYLHSMIKRQDLVIINTSPLCKGGPITRRRMVEGRVEESAIDFILASPELGALLVSATIDSNQIYTLTKYTTTKGNEDIKKSDHFPLIAKFKVKQKPCKPKNLAPVSCFLK